MKSTPRLLILAGALALAACAKTPDRLAADMQAAIDKKDVNALLALADLEQTPAMARWALMGLPNDCSAPMVCKVTLKPIDDAWTKESAEMLTREEAEWKAKPEGLVIIEGKPDPNAPKEQGGRGSLNLDMPYAKVGDGYKIVMARPTAASLAKMKATTAEQQTDAMLAMGIGAPGKSERNMEWKTTATPLPAGGGEAGEAYLAYVAKVAAALKADDVEAMTAATGDWGRIVMGPKDWSGKDIPLDQRQRTMRAQGVRMVVDAKVLGGYQLGDQVVLIVEGTNGAGNTVRGGSLLEKQPDGAWDRAGDVHLEIPAGA